MERMMDELNTVDSQIERKLTSNRKNTMEGRQLRPCSGYLFKRSRSMFGGWMVRAFCFENLKRRYFVLENKRLVYYDKESETFPRGVLNFDLCLAEIVDWHDSLFT